MSVENDMNWHSVNENKVMIKLRPCHEPAGIFGPSWHSEHTHGEVKYADARLTEK